MAIREKIGKVSYVHKGTYNSSSTYNRLDVVNYNGSSYVSKTDNNTSSPTDTSAWTLLAYSPVKGVDYWTQEELAEFAMNSEFQPFKTSVNETLGIHTSQINALNGFVFDENWDSKQLTNAINTYYAMQYDSKVYEVRFPNWSKSTTPLGTKGLANANLSCTPATDTTFEVTNYPINFMPIDVNAHVEDDGLRLIDSIIGMKNFKSTGKVNVFSMKRTYWHRLFIEDNDLVYQRTFVPKNGFTIVPQAINKDGSYNMFILRGKYVVGDIDGDLYSSKGLIPAHYLNMNASQHPSEEEFSDGISYTGCIPLFKRQGVYYSAGLIADYMDIYLTFLLMFATKDSQTVIAGNTMNNLQYNVSAAETDVHRVVLTNAQAANFDLKTYVSVGDRESNTNNDRNNAYMHNIAYDVQIIGKEEVDNDHTALILDHTNFDTTSTTWVSSMHERSGYSDYVLGNNGSIGSNTNGKHGAVIDGVEIMVGGYEVAGNAIMNIADSTGKREVYYTNDVSKLSNSYATIQSTYKKSSLEIQPTTLNAWNYITEYGFDLEDGIAVPTQAGASGSGSAVGYADGLYVDNGTSGQGEFLLLGGLHNAANAGLSCVNAYLGVSLGGWHVLARLSINGVGGELTE